MHNAIVTIYSQVAHQPSAIRRFWFGVSQLSPLRPILRNGNPLALPFYDFDLRASHARTLLPAALASVPFGFVLVRVRVNSLEMPLLASAFSSVLRVHITFVSGLFVVVVASTGVLFYGVGSRKYAHTVRTCTYARRRVG